MIVGFIIAFKSKVNMSNNCIIHHPQIKISDINKLTFVTESRYGELVETKYARQNLGGIQLHSNQCAGIPDSYVEGMAYHIECYKNFTRARAELKKSESSASTQSSMSKAEAAPARPKRSRETDTSGRFPDLCMFCKQIELRYKGNRQQPTNIITDTSELTLRKAVALHNDKVMADAIQDVDLKVKDFKKHKQCYKAYTAIVSNEAKKKNEDDQMIDKWELVKQAIHRTIVTEERCLSLDTLLELNGIENKDHHSRRNMKSWLKRNYGDKIVFLTPEINKGQVVMSKASLEAVSRGEKVVHHVVPSSDNASIKQAGYCTSMYNK